MIWVFKILLIYFDILQFSGVSDEKTQFVTWVYRDHARNIGKFKNDKVNE